MRRTAVGTCHCVIRTAYLRPMRPEDILVPTPAGVCCKLGGFHIDPDAAGRQGPDHARPFRPCARRPRRGAGDAGDARPDAAALRREFRRLDAGGRLRRDRDGSAARASPSIRPATCSARRRSRRGNGLRIVVSGDYKDVADPTCAPFELVPCDVFITEATFGLPVFRHGDAGRRDRQAPAFGRAVSRARASRRRLFARQGAARDRAAPRGRLRQADLSARRAGEASRATTKAAASSSATCAACAAPARPSLRAPSCSARRRPLQDLWSRRFPDPVTAFASGWMRVRARARQRGVELPLVISDHADWDDLTATIAATGAPEDLGDARPGGRAGALVREPRARGAAARHRRLWRRGRDRRHHCGSGRGRRGPDDARDEPTTHEPLRRTARPPRLRARPQQQAAADRPTISAARPTPSAAVRWRR